MPKMKYYDEATSQWVTLDAKNAEAITDGVNTITPQKVKDIETKIDNHTSNADIHFTSAERTKLSGIATNANNYVLPNATVSSVGGVRVGGNLIVTSGVVSVPSASTSLRGVVQLNNTTTSTSTTEALAANQGKVLNDKIDVLTGNLNTTNSKIDIHVKEIATTEKLGHIKPDGVTIIVDPDTGKASAQGGSGELYQENVTRNDTNNAIGIATVAFPITYLSRINNTNNTNKTFKVDDIAGLSVGNEVNIHHVFDGIIGTGVVSGISGATVTLNTAIELSSLTQFISIFDVNNTSDKGGFASGISSFASGSASIAIGLRALATSSYSLALGLDAIARGSGSVAIGGGVSSGNGSLVIGTGTATESSACSIGSGNISSGAGSMALGDNTTASGKGSHSEGFTTTAEGNYSHSQNYYTQVKSFAGTAIGSRNKAMNGNPTSFLATADAFVIGNESSVVSSGSNAFRVTFDGKVYGKAAYNSTGADYAEYFEWSDGNVNSEDRVGFVVTLDGDKIRKATSTDNYILGIISVNPSVVGDSHQEDWQSKYKTDEWGRIQYHYVDTEYEEIATINDGNALHNKTVTKVRRDYVPIVNPQWNSHEEYIPRENRKEWSAVGLMGKLLVRDDGTCQVNSYAKVGLEEGTITHSAESTNMRVIERVTPNIVRVFIK